ncbi:MAG: hypothetical protein AB7G15_12860 [Alphaproteobacteria bacterium]
MRFTWKDLGCKKFTKNQAKFILHDAANIRVFRINGGGRLTGGSGKDSDLRIQVNGHTNYYNCCGILTDPPKDMITDGGGMWLPMNKWACSGDASFEYLLSYQKIGSIDEIRDLNAVVGSGSLQLRNLRIPSPRRDVEILNWTAHGFRRIPDSTGIQKLIIQVTNGTFEGEVRLQGYIPTRPNRRRKMR